MANSTAQPAQQQVTSGHDSRQSIHLSIDGCGQIETNLNARTMRISTASLALVAVLAAPVITTASSAAAWRDLSAEQSHALFKARKTWAKDNYRRRLELLQSQQRCIDRASSSDALKVCRLEMKQARRSLKRDYRAYMKNVRIQLRLPARTGTKRDAKARNSQA